MNEDDISVLNVCICGICHSSAHKMKNGCFQCSEEAGHMADGFCGIWSDMSYPLIKEKALPQKAQMIVITDGDDIADPPKGFTKEAFKKFIKGMEQMNEKMVFIDHQESFILTSDLHVGSPLLGSKEKPIRVKVDPTVIVSVPKPVLLNPRSAFGKMIRAKLDRLKGKE